LPQGEAPILLPEDKIEFKSEESEEYSDTVVENLSMPQILV